MPKTLVESRGRCLGAWLPLLVLFPSGRHVIDRRFALYPPKVSAVEVQHWSLRHWSDGHLYGDQIGLGLGWS